ncbi:MAG: hypothetical protein HQM09_04375 [Candidatus Riflebacteria bacterium]|nr:hypothetical protein [Candidatus Riflebacteria bacterium]
MKISTQGSSTLAAIVMLLFTTNAASAGSPADSSAFSHTSGQTKTIMVVPTASSANTVIAFSATEAGIPIKSGGTGSGENAIPDPAELMKLLPVFPKTLQDAANMASTFRTLAVKISREAEKAEFLADSSGEDDQDSGMVSALNMADKDRDRLTKLQIILTELNDPDQELKIHKCSSAMQRGAATLSGGNRHATDVTMALNVIGNAFTIYRETVQMRTEALGGMAKSIAESSHHPLITETARQIRKRLLDDLAQLVQSADTAISAVNEALHP